VGGEAVPSITVELNRDFRRSGHRVEDLTLFRYMFMPRDLLDAESRNADYSACHDIAVQPDQGDQQLRLRIGFESEQNQCILAKMGPRDRMLWESIIADFDEALAVAAPSPDADHIRARNQRLSR